MGNYIHRTRGGTDINLEDMTDTHLENTIKKIDSLSLNGITIIYSSNEWGEIHYDEEYLKGSEVKEYLNWSIYLKEKQRRNLIKELKQYI